MRITVDGEPIDDPSRSSSDVQRCTDVAMKRADIRFGFDNLTSSPRLSVAASSPVLGAREEDGSIRDTLRFRMYDNYAHFIERAEIRISTTPIRLWQSPLTWSMWRMTGSPSGNRRSNAFPDRCAS